MHCKAIVLAIYLCCYIPQSLEGVENSAITLLAYAETNDTDGIVQTVETLQTSLTDAQDPVREARKFLQSFVDEMNTRYGTQLTIGDACHLVKEHLDELQIPQEVRVHFLTTIELFEEKSPEPTLHQREKYTAAQIHWHFYPPWKWNFFGLKQHRHHHRSHYCAAQVGRPEFFLPDRMATGVACMFGGALLCIIPFPVIQGIGVGMISGGFWMTLDGITNGERPYYKNSETGEVTPFGKVPE